MHCGRFDVMRASVCFVVPVGFDVGRTPPPQTQHAFTGLTPFAFEFWANVPQELFQPGHNCTQGRIVVSKFVICVFVAIRSTQCGELSLFRRVCARTFTVATRCGAGVGRLKTLTVVACEFSKRMVCSAHNVTRLAACVWRDSVLCGVLSILI